MLPELVYPYDLQRLASNQYKVIVNMFFFVDLHLAS